MRTTDAQVRRLMEEMARHGKVGVAAMRAGMDRKTARRYVRAGRLPSEMAGSRTWRTRRDPFAEDWPRMAAMLREAPEFEAKTLFELLQASRPERYHAGQLRSFQRRVKQWRAQEGPPREVFLPQDLRPGEAMQTDFTWASELGVTVGGVPFAHMLCHPVLPYSNWEWATVCHSESMAALRRGVQEAVFRLGRVPRHHQTDHSTAATHRIGEGSERGFNEEYVALMRHLGMEPRTTEVGEKQQNGDVEALNGALKRRLEQHLLVRGSRDFESVEGYEAWLGGVLERANALRAKRLREELAVMRPLAVERLAEWREVPVRVSQWGTIRVKRNSYSVPSRLRGERVLVRVGEAKIEVWHGQKLQLAVERLRGEGRHRIDYRHVIWSLVRKPGGFRCYRFREEMFPTTVFREAYDALVEALGERRAEIEYLRVLHLAASTFESEVEAALGRLLGAGAPPTSEAVKALVAPAEPAVPSLAVPEVDLCDYDGLLGGKEVA